MSALLECSELSIEYGGVRAVDAVTLRVEEGTLVGLIGPNGAGKTSLIDAITGFTPTFTGHVLFDGTDITRLAPHRRARLGLARTFQSLELFDDLSVLDNLLAAAEDPRWWTVFADLVRPERNAAGAAAAIEALHAVGIERLSARSPDEISQGERKLVSIARALAGQPRLLLLDEPASGLSTTESEHLGERLRGLVGDGRSLLLVDHDMNLVLGVCDIVYVLDFGRVLASGTPDEIRKDPKVLAAYLGHEVAPT